MLEAIVECYSLVEFGMKSYTFSTVKIYKMPAGGCVGWGRGGDGDGLKWWQIDWAYLGTYIKFQKIKI